MAGTQNDISRNALSLARMIDRLGPGKYTVYLAKSEGESNRWIVEIAQPVTLHKKELQQDTIREQAVQTITVEAQHV